MFLPSIFRNDVLPRYVERARARIKLRAWPATRDTMNNPKKEKKEKKKIKRKRNEQKERENAVQKLLQRENLESNISRI